MRPFIGAFVSLYVSVAAVGNGFACFSRVPVPSICDRLPLVATAALRKYFTHHCVRAPFFGRLADTVAAARTGNAHPRAVASD